MPDVSAAEKMQLAKLKSLFSLQQSCYQCCKISELQMQSRGANGRSHTSFLTPVPPFKWDTWFGGSRWWHCGLAQKKCTEHLKTRSAQTKKKNAVKWWTVSTGTDSFPTSTTKEKTLLFFKLRTNIKI